MELFTDGIVKSGDRDFTRLVGGFGEDSPTITDKQVAELLGYRHGARHVRSQVNENIKAFETENDVYVKDIQRLPVCDSVYNALISIGYVKQSITQAKNIYIFSQEGFLLFCQIADIKEDYSEFEKNYFGSNKLISITPMRYELGFWNILLRTFKSIINFSPQYSCCNNKYRIDFYTPKYNLAVEYDEKGHRNKMSEDKIREQEIHNELGCNFIRVKKGKELEGINNIFKYILNNKKEMFFNG